MSFHMADELRHPTPNHFGYATVLSTDQKTALQVNLYKREATIQADLRRQLTSSALDQIGQMQVQIEEGKTYEWPYASTIASIETAALEYRNQTLTVLPYFAPLHRLERTLQIAQGTRSEGDCVYIGCGPALPEIAAVKIKPPTNSDIESFFLDSNPLPTLENLQDNTPSEMDYFGGLSIGIEPDPKQALIVPIMRMFMNYPSEHFVFYNSTLDDAIDAGAIPNGVDRIVWNRCDPEILSSHFRDPLDGNPTQKIREDVLNKMKQLVSMVKQGGSILITVGRGDDESARAWRKSLVVILSDIFSSGEFNIKSVISKTTADDPQDKLSFGGEFGCEEFVSIQLQ